MTPTQKAEILEDCCPRRPGGSHNHGLVGLQKEGQLPVAEVGRAEGAERRKVGKGPRR